MPNGDTVRQEAAEAIEDARRLRADMAQFFELSAIEAAARDDRQHRQITDDLERARNRAVELLERISQLLDQISHETADPSGLGAADSVAFRLTMTANELQAELEWLKAILEQLDSIIHATSTGQPTWFASKAAQPVQAALTKLKSYLMPMLKKLLAKLWSVISHLLTPKEWKLKGKVGNTVLGLAGAEIEITFGP